MTEMAGARFNAKVVIEYDLLKWWADVRKDHPNWKIFFPASFAIVTGHSIPGTYARRVFVAATGETLWRNAAYFSEGYPSSA